MLSSATLHRSRPGARVCSAVLVLACGCAMAQVDDDGSERARIAAQRAQANAHYEAQAADCRRRFVVTACLDDAQRQRREALDGLRRQQLLLDDALRQRRAADRMEAIRAKEAAAQAAASSSSSQTPLAPPKVPPTTMRLRQAPSNGRDRAAASAASGASDTVEQPPSPAPVVPAPTGRPRADQADRVSGRDAASERARLKRQHDQQDRQAEMAAHRQAVERRNAERAAAAKPTAAPLPAPAGAAGR